MKRLSKSTASIIGAALMLLAIIAALFWSFQQIKQAAAQRQHIDMELDGANELLSSLKDAETSFRGFLLTGDETYLEPYQSVRGTILNQLRSLRKSTLIPAAQQHVDAMMPLVEAELAETARVIDLRRHEDVSILKSQVSIEEGKRLMDALRDETRAFLKIEKGALEVREESFQKTIRTMFGIIIVTSLLAALLGIRIAFLKHQDARHHADTLIHVEAQRLLIALQKTNEQLESARLEAVQANNAKSDFLSSMSHELRTPLNAILGFAQLMQTDTPPPSKIQELSIGQILKAGWHLLELVNQILDLAQIESGKALISMELVALDDIMHDCQSMIEPQARKQKVRLTFTSLKVPCFLYADSTRLKQCLINLLSNAIKYNRANGAVAVEWLIPEPGRVRINIRDTGFGLTPEQLAKLFQIFNRLGQEYGLTEGSGIGLVVTRQLVELMGGTIGVVSEVGVGSMFWLEFAVAAAAGSDPRGVQGIEALAGRTNLPV